MPIVKIKRKERNFVTISNDIAQNKDLTYEAKGMLTELLSRPENWKLIKSQLTREHTKEVKITRILRELQVKGYLWIVDLRNDNNSTIEDRIWFVFEEPKNREEVLSYSKETLNRGNLSLREPHTTNNIINTNKKNSTKKENNITSILDSLSKSKKELVEIIFEFWNGCKSSGKWQGHRKLNKDIAEAILLNLKDYSVEDICEAIHNYALVLQSDKYYWDYVWPLSTFLIVKTGKCKDDPKKWWRFLEENFVEENYISRYNNNKPSSPAPTISPNPELTNLIIEYYGIYKKGDGQYKPLDSDYSKFVEATKLMVLFHEEDNYPSKKEWAKNLFQMLRAQYGDKGNGITPAYICSANTWYELMPEFYSLHLGVGHSWVKNGANRVREYFDKG